MTRQQAEEMLRRASASVQRLNRRLAIEIPYPDEIPHPVPILQGPQPEQAVRHESLAKSQRAEKGAPGIAVRITSFRRRLLDPDNLCAKSILDGLRYAELIPNDRPQDITLTVRQEKCGKGQERTEVRMDWIT